MLSRTGLSRMTRNEFAHLGEGELGYIRKMRSEDVSKVFPEAPEMSPGLDLWALFGADGTPLLLTDNRSSTFYKAAEDELETVSLH